MVKSLHWVVPTTAGLGAQDGHLGSSPIFIQLLSLWALSTICFCILLVILLKYNEIVLFYFYSILFLH